MKKQLLVIVAGACALSCVTVGKTLGVRSSFFPPASEILGRAQRSPCLVGSALAPVPATVVSVGEFARVPYHSYSDGKIELNIYGDPAYPSAVEIGTKVEVEHLRSCIAHFVAGLISKEAETALTTDLSLTQDAKDFSGLKFEITPASAADAYGAWWATAWSPDDLSEARSSDEEFSELVGPPGSFDYSSVPPSSDWAPAQTSARSDSYSPPATPYGAHSSHRGSSGGPVYVHGYTRRDGTYVHSYTRRR
jgi:hypothetical protein